MLPILLWIAVFSSDGLQPIAGYKVCATTAMNAVRPSCIETGTPGLAAFFFEPGSTIYIWDSEGHILGELQLENFVDHESFFVLISGR